MDGFLSWFFAFVTSLIRGVGQIFGGVAAGVWALFDLPSHVALFRAYCGSFGAVDWILAVLACLAIYALILLLVAMAVLLVRKYLRFRRSAIGREQVLEELARMNAQVERLTREKAALLSIKVGQTEAALGESAEAEETSPEAQGRFSHLIEIDRRYAAGTPTVAPCDMTLRELCDAFRAFACSRLGLYYEPKTVRLMLAGLSASRLIVLQGISGTGKTSLPYALGKFFGNDATIAPVQPAWNDRTSLLGYYNEFTGRFNETEVLRRIYEAGYREDVNLIVLDEMNIARVEYYFAELLSVLELPDPAAWQLELVPSVMAQDPVRLVNGYLTLPSSVWYIGTANNDDTTYAIADKVYDRAMVVDLDTRGTPFAAPDTPPVPIGYRELLGLFERARAEYPVGEGMLARIEELDAYVVERFRVSFGNRILRQIKTFVPVYVACGGEETEGIDYLLATKVLRKFEALNFSLIRDELDGLAERLDMLFGVGRMACCIAYLERLKKMY